MPRQADARLLWIMAMKPHHRWRQRAYLAYSRLSRGMTLGVRGLLIEDDRVILVKHSYVRGWYLPGGGVEPGETLAEAMEREVREEAGAVLTRPPELFAIYRNIQADRRDHVALFVCRDFQRSAERHRPNLEIVGCEAFPLDALPDDATPSTRARLREVLTGRTPAPDW